MKPQLSWTTREFKQGERVRTLILTAVAVLAAVVAMGIAGILSNQSQDAKTLQDKVSSLAATKAATEKQLTAAQDVLKGTGSPSVPTKQLLAQLPSCALEDGSTQEACVWDGRKQGNKVGAIVVNLDHGHISFYPQTNGWVVN